ncbi:hypothetical protein DMUE_3983 [Dictyocoela muelleri]|nr:hypothetical protein DMUE_3983 [Dictyocoela muelleri]
MNDKIDSDFFNIFFTIAVKRTDNKNLGIKIGERLADDFYLKLNLKKPEFKDIPDCINLFFSEYFGLNTEKSINDHKDDYKDDYKDYKDDYKDSKHDYNIKNKNIIITPINGNEFTLIINHIGFDVFFNCLKTIFSFLNPDLNVFVRDNKIVFSGINNK